MENFLTSMSTKTTPQEKTEDSDIHEESSWTFYFEDFLCNNNINDDEHHHSSLSSGYESPSLVSDAASSVAKKFVYDHAQHQDQDHHEVAVICLDKSKSLSFKKRKTKGAILVHDIDHDLEDTASSPVNSPKVSHFNRLHTIQREKDNMDISEEKKGNNTSGHTNVLSDDQLGIAGRDSDYSELKKRGLCLVPLSMLANYNFT